jgi:hypothetical protein
MDRTVMRSPVHPAGVEEHITRKRIASELGRSHARPGQPALVRIGKGEPKPMMYERGKSDPAVVAAKRANKAERSVAEPVEPRAGTKGNADQQHTGRTQSRETVSPALARIRLTAKNSDSPSLTRGRSCMRESRTYNLCGGRGVISVPTATPQTVERG